MRHKSAGVAVTAEQLQPIQRHDEEERSTDEWEWSDSSADTLLPAAL